MVASAVRAAVIDRFAPNPETVAMLEESEVDSPLEAVAFMIQPESVWLYEEAMAAFPGQTRAHVARARGQARRLEAWLPLAAFPRSSELVRRGCHLIRDDDPATRITEMLLLKYKALLEARKDYTTLAN
jgi:hypothetical protein